MVVPGPVPPRWAEEGLSISFRSCELTGLGVLKDALRQTGADGASSVAPSDVRHLDLAENELTGIDELRAFSRAMSLDVSHNPDAGNGRVYILLSG